MRFGLANTRDQTFSNPRFEPTVASSALLPNLTNGQRRIAAQHESLDRLRGSSGVAIRTRIRPKLSALML